MIPKIDTLSPQQTLYIEFLADLRKSSFAGDVSDLLADRLVLSTDNSIYQVLPQGVVNPKSIDDLACLAKLSQQEKYHSIKLTPRGGGTGTNAQSLTDGLVVDLSKYMNAILEINQAERWARVQAGVVKDQLNAALKPYGLFFAPDLSTSNRATIGGMINTDASGQGSCLYGKTRDHVLELKSVLLDGDIIETHAIDDAQLNTIIKKPTRSGTAHKLINAIDAKYRPVIRNKFPKLNRCLTGYDLAHIRDEQNHFNLNNILCGSEGTLAFVAEAKLNLLPIPKVTALAVVKYANFENALRDAARLMIAKPTSIETIDSKVLNLAMNDMIWQEVEAYFPPESKPIQGINLVEFTANDEATLKKQITRFKRVLEQKKVEDTMGFTLAMGHDAVNRIWAMRKKAVGLLGNAQGEARPIPFVEDTAVPPEHLADFIMAFRAILDEHGLSYGMFGHVDAGVLHVRPAIDMKDPKQEPLIRTITDKVAELTQQYHGLLWGEHGKGVRSEYAPTFFGNLYPLLQRIKAAFDPHNQLNPGKIATPSKDAELLKIDGVPTRGQQDRLIPVKTWEGFKEAVYCNGNGLCYNWDAQDAMCPSWKATRERRHSPKGRASLMREWIKQLGERQFDPVAALQTSHSAFHYIATYPKRLKYSRAKRRGEYDFSHEVQEAMSGCLACKSCSGQCPIKVDVPTFRSQFLYLYHQRYTRPVKDYLVGSLEFMLPIFAKTPKLYNAFTQSRLMTWAFSRLLGFEDAPALSTNSVDTQIKSHNIPMATQRTLNGLSDHHKRRAIVIVQDAFTRYFDADVVTDIALLLQKLGYYPMLAPYKPNGKPLHVHGFLGKFKTVAKKQQQSLAKIEAAGIPMIGIDPAMTLTYRSEYKHALGDEAPKVALLQEWLLGQKKTLATKANLFTAGGQFKLLAHCTEKTNAAGAVTAWQDIFGALGQTITPVAVGCCGMSGTYGHERDHKAQSSQLFAMSWNRVVTEPSDQGKLAATGYSCRSQTKREAFVKLPHPAQLLLQRLIHQEKNL